MDNQEIIIVLTREELDRLIYLLDRLHDPDANHILQKIAPAQVK